MGLFDKLKIKSKDEGKAWMVNKKRGTIEITENYIRLMTTFPKGENIVFFKDVTTLEKKYAGITIKTNSEEHHINPIGFGDAKQDLADEVYVQLLEKVSEYK